MNIDFGCQCPWFQGKGGLIESRRAEHVYNVVGYAISLTRNTHEIGIQLTVRVFVVYNCHRILSWCQALKNILHG